MKWKHAVTWSALGLAGMLVAGCSKDNPVSTTADQPPVGVTNEQQARLYVANNDEFVSNDELTIADSDIQPTNYTVGEFGKIDTAFTPLRWGRFVLSVVRTVTDTVIPGDSIAVVHIHKVITGVLKVRGINSHGDTSLIQKPFTDNSDRNVIFRRLFHQEQPFWQRWFPVATSLVAGGTQPPNNLLAITQIQLRNAGGTITVTDPLQFYLRYWWPRRSNRGNEDVPRLIPGTLDTISVTVVSTSSDTDLVALRFGVGQFFRRRLQMHLVSEHNNGNGTFTRVFETPFRVHFHAGFFHATVDAATHATFFDDSAPYSASWWGIPYRVL